MVKTRRRAKYSEGHLVAKQQTKLRLLPCPSMQSMFTQNTPMGHTSKHISSVSFRAVRGKKLSEVITIRGKILSVVKTHRRDITVRCKKLSEVKTRRRAKYSGGHLVAKQQTKLRLLPCPSMRSMFTQNTPMGHKSKHISSVSFRVLPCRPW